LVVDLNMSNAAGMQLVKQLSRHRDVPVVFAGDRARLRQHGKRLEAVLAQAGVDWVSTPIDDTELRLRINRATARTAKVIETWSVGELRSDASGRLDAALIAKHLGWKLTDLSRALGRSVQAVHKTPDAPALQQRLEKLERAVLLARRLVSADAVEFRKWLNTPSPDLDEQKPGELLLEKPDVVVQWLEDAALGHPA
jgi:CheY-like chemotaxis protein